MNVLLIANESLLADVFEMVLTQHLDLNLLRLAPSETHKIDRAIQGLHPGIIIIEEKGFNPKFFTSCDWFWGNGQRRVITINSDKQILHIYEKYQAPISGVDQVVDLIKETRAG